MPPSESYDEYYSVRPTAMQCREQGLGKNTAKVGIKDPVR